MEKGKKIQPAIDLKSAGREILQPVVDLKFAKGKKLQRQVDPSSVRMQSQCQSGCSAQSPTIILGTLEKGKI